MERAAPQTGHNRWDWRRVCFLLLCCLGLMGCQPAVPTGRGLEVRQVLSGQEIELVGLADQPEITERVWLAGIEVPDLAQQPWGAAAKARLTDLIGRRSVRIEATERDQDGRRLGYLWQDDRLLNEQLVAEGQAIVPPNPSPSPYHQRLTHAQERARILGLGIWNPKKPLRQTPSAFRNQQRN